jgi:hypothetical protein
MQAWHSQSAPALTRNPVVSSGGLQGKRLGAPLTKGYPMEDQQREQRVRVLGYYPAQFSVL